MSLWKRIVAWTAICLLWFQPEVFAQGITANNIVTDGRSQTQLQVNGNTTTITTKTVAGANAYNSFSQFQLGSGNTANLVLPDGTSNLINLIRNGQTVINGALNGYKNGQIGGNVYFADPYGMVVGATGSINVGSLNVSTPTAAALESVIDAHGNPNGAATSQLLAGTMPLSPDGVILIRGQVNAKDGVTLQGQKVTIAGPGAAPQIGSANKHQQVFDSTVNTSGMQTGGAIVVDHGDIEIVAAGDARIAGTLSAKGAPGQPGATITATAGHDIAVASTAVISVNGQGVNSNGGQIKFKAGNNAKIASGATFNASAGTSGNGGKIELSAKNTLTLGAAKIDTGATDGKAGSTLIDPTNVVIASSGGTQTSIDSNGGSVDIVADNSITVQSGAYINTRKTVTTGNTPQPDDTTTASVGNSGNITLQAPTIVVDGVLNSFANAGFTSGTVTLIGQSSGSITVSAPAALTLGTSGTSYYISTILSNGGNISVTAAGTLTLAANAVVNAQNNAAGSAVTDVSAMAAGNAGNIALTAPSIVFATGINPEANPAGTVTTGALLLAGAKGGGFTSGTITLNAGSFDLTASTPIYGAGANLQLTASNSITLEAGGLIDVRGDGYAAAHLTAPTITFANGINTSGGFTFRAAPRDRDGGGLISLAATNGFTLGTSNQIKTLGADIWLSTTGTIALGTTAVIDTTVATTATTPADAGNITLSAATLTVAGINTTGSVQLLAGAVPANGLTPGTITLSASNGFTFNASDQVKTLGANLTLNAGAGTITLADGTVIDTRVSGGNAGNIALTAATISFADGINNGASTPQLLASAASGKTAGTITLTANSFTLGAANNIATLGANIALIANTSLTLGSGSAIDARVGGNTSTANSGNISLTAPSLVLTGGINNGASTPKLLAGATGAFLPGTIDLTATSGSLTLDSTDPIFSLGANIGLFAGGGITLATTAKIDARTGTASTLKSGTITLSGPTVTFAGGINGTNEAQLLAGDTGHGAGTIDLTATAANGGFTIGATNSIDTKGANLLLVASGAGSTISIGSTATVHAGSGSLTLSASTVTIDPNASVTTIGFVLAGADIDITSANSVTLPGQNVTIDATSSITIEAGGFIDTRAWNTGGQAIANSGSITLDAPVITINGGGSHIYTLDAGANGVFTAGNITLNATLLSEPNTPAGNTTATTSIALANNAGIRGGNVSLTASSSANMVYTPTGTNIDYGLPSQVGEGLLASTTVNVLGATANSTIDVALGSSIVASGSVMLSAAGEETVSFQDMAIQGPIIPGALAVIVGAVHSNVGVTVEGSVSAGQNLTVAAYNDATLNISAWSETNPLLTSFVGDSGGLFAGGVSVAYANLNTNAAIQSTASIAANGQVAILARDDNSFSNKVTALALGSAPVGFAVAVSQETSNATATDAANLGTAANKVGSVLIEADTYTRTNLTEASSTAGANALVTVLSQLSAPNGAVLVGSAATSALAASVFSLPTGLGSSSSNLFKASATVAYAQESQNAQAGIAGSSGATAPTIQSTGPVAIYANTVDTGMRDDAQSSVGSASSANANPISTSSNYSFSVALMLGFYDHTAEAYIGPGVTVNASDVGVGSNIALPIDNEFACSSQPCSFSEFLSHLNGNFGAANDVATTFVSATGQAAVAGAAGAIDWFQVTDNSSAWIGDGAVINSTAAGTSSWSTAIDQGTLSSLPPNWRSSDAGTITWATPVTVTATTSIQTVDIGGNICLSINCTGGSSANASTLGGSFIGIFYNDTTSAGIGAYARVTAAGDLTVAAKNDDEIVAIAPSSGFGGANSLVGLLAMTNIDNSTNASISNTAAVSAPDVSITADQNLMVWAVTGGITIGTTTGVGVSIAVNQINTDTLAFIGDNSADETGFVPGAPFTPAIGLRPIAGIATNNLTVVAGSSGEVGALSLAAAAAINGPPSPPSAIGNVIGGLSSVLNGNFAPLGFVGIVSGVAASTPTPPSAGISTTGSFSVDQTGMTTEANLFGAKVTGFQNAAAAQSVAVNAIDDTYLIGASGSGSLTSSNSPATELSAAIAGAVSVLLATDDTIAFIGGSSTVSAGAVQVAAMSGAAEISIGIAIAINSSLPFTISNAGAGSISVATIDDATNAYIDDSTITGTSNGNLQVVAFSDTKIGAGGGSLSVNPALTGGNNLGAAWTTVEIDDPTQSGDNTGHSVDAEIMGSTITAYNNVSVLGIDLDQIELGAATAALSVGANGLAGAVTMATLNGSTDAGIGKSGATTSTITASGTVTVLATGDANGALDQPFENAISNLGVLNSADVEVASQAPDGTTSPGAAVIGVAGQVQSGRNNAGISVAYSGISETRSAIIDGATVSANTVKVAANGDDSIKGFAVGVSAAFGSLSGVGSATGNVISDTIIAKIDDSATITASTVSVQATDNAAIESFAGGLAFAPTGAVGAAIAYNKIGGGSVEASAEAATFTNTTSLTISAKSDGLIESAAIAGAGSSSVAVSGSFTTNFTDNDVTAQLVGISFNDTAGTITVSADDSGTIQSLAGSGSYGPGGAVGAAIAVNQIEDDTTAQIFGAANTSIVAKDVVVAATSTGTIQTMAIGIAFSSGALAGAGSIATNLMSGSVTAQIGQGADIDAQDNVDVIANTADTISVIAGAAGVGTSTVGAGLSLVVNDISDSTVAQITGANTIVDAQGLSSSDTYAANTGDLANPVPDDLGSLSPSAVPPNLSESTTAVRGLAVDATATHAVSANAVTLGVSAQLFGSNSLAVNLVTDVVSGTSSAHIDNALIDTRLTGNPTVANYVGPQLYVVGSGQDYSNNFDISGAASGIGLGAGAVAIVGTTLSHESDAYIDNATIGTMYTEVTPVSQTQIGTFTPTPTYAPNSDPNKPPDCIANCNPIPIYATTQNKTLVPVLGAVTVKAKTIETSNDIVVGFAAGIVNGVGGSIVVNTFEGTDKAYVTGGALKAGSLAVNAFTENDFAAGGGAGAAGLNVGAAAVIAVNVSKDVTLAYVGDSTAGDETTALALKGTLSVNATTNDDFNSVMVSAGLGGVTGVAGMIDVTVANNDTEASLYSSSLNLLPLVSTTTSTDAQGDQTTTNDYTGGGKIATPSGNVSVGANENLTIHPYSGAGAASVVGAGVGAGLNIVVARSHTTAQIQNSTLDSAGSDVSVAAQSIKDITGTAATAAAGGTTGIGGAISLFIVGYGNTGDVATQYGGSLSTVDTVTNGGAHGGFADPSLTPTQQANLTSQSAINVETTVEGTPPDQLGVVPESDKDAITAQIDGGFVVANSVEVTATSQISTKNTVSAAAVGDVNGIGGSIGYTRVYDNVTAATNLGTITTPSLSITAQAGDANDGHAAEVDAYAGGGGILGLSAGVADALISDNVTASLGGTVTAPANATTPAQISVEADDASTIFSDAIGGALGGVGVGAMVANASKTSTVIAQIPAANGNQNLPTSAGAGLALSLAALDGGQVEASSVGAAGGALAGGTGAVATAVDNATVTASIGSGVAIAYGGGSITLNAVDVPDVSALAFGVAVGVGASLGISQATATADPTVTASIGDHASFSGSGDFIVQAEVMPPLQTGPAPTYTAYTKSTVGTGGILVSAGASLSTSLAESTAVAQTGTDVALPDGNVSITATNNTSEYASGSGVTVGGGLGIGSSEAHANANTTTTQATLGGGNTTSSDRGGALVIKATGTDTLQADAKAGTGGLAAGSASVATTSDNANVSATTTSGTTLSAGALSILATHTDDYAATADSTNAASLGASGANGTNNATSTVTASIGDSDNLTVGANVVVSATNNFLDTVSGNSVKGAAGGVINGAAVLSTTNITANTNATFGNNVTLTSGSDALGNPGGIDLVAVTMLRHNDTIALTTGGALSGAGVTASLNVTINDTVSTGTGDRITSYGDIDIGNYAQVFANTSALVDTYGAASAGVATANTNVTVNQNVTINGGNSILTAYGNVNLTAGDDPTGYFGTLLFGSATAEAYVYGIVTVPSATGNIDFATNAGLTIAQGATVRAAENVFLAADPTNPTVSATGEAHFDEFGIPITKSNDHNNSPSPVSTLTVNGAVVAGAFSTLTITIPNCQDRGIFCDQVSISQNSEAVTATYVPNFNPASTSIALPSAPGTVGAFTLSPLFAAGGVVTVLAGSISGHGSITANGSPSITVTNNSPDYLEILAAQFGSNAPISALIPNQPGGVVNFAGTAQRNDAIAAGIAVNPIGATGTPSIKISNAYNPAFNPEVGPNLYVDGQVNNLGGNIQILNSQGSYASSGGVLGQTVVIDIPNGFAVINLPATAGVAYIGGNPFSEWANFMIWPGGNPATLNVTPGNPTGKPDATEAVAWAANAAYAAGVNFEFGSMTQATLNSYLYGNAGDAATPLVPGDTINYNKTQYTLGTGLKNRSIILYGDCEVMLGGNCSASNASAIELHVTAGATPANYLLNPQDGNSDHQGYYAMVPLTTMSRTSSGTIAQQYAQASISGGSSAVFGLGVDIIASVIDIAGTISVGQATSYSLDLPASYMTAPTSSQQIVGYTVTPDPNQDPGSFTCILDPNNCQTVTPIYQTFYSGGGAIADYIINHNAGVAGYSATTMDLGNGVTYNLTTNQIVLPTYINVSSDGAHVKLSGAIVSTNNQGAIVMNSGLGQIGISNETGIPLTVQNVDAGTNATTGALTSTIDINDSLKGTQTWYVFNPGSAVQVYSAAYNPDPTASLDPPSGLAASTSCSATSCGYSPLQGERFNWQLDASMARTLTVNVNGCCISTASNWVFTSGTSNNPWTYGGNGSITPQGSLSNNPSLENTVFKQTITGSITSQQGFSWGYEGCGGGVGSGCHWGFVENDTTPQPSADWVYEYVTGAHLTMLMSVKADNPIAISFTGNQTGNISINSNSSIVLAGQITNPNGNTTINAYGTNSSITETPGTNGGNITTNNLTLSATAGIGTSTQAFKATLTSNGAAAPTLNAIAGSQGLYVNLDSGAHLGNIISLSTVVNQPVTSQQTFTDPTTGNISTASFTAYGDDTYAVTAINLGDIVINATGDLLPVSSSNYILGHDITLNSSAGAVGSAANPFTLYALGSSMDIPPAALSAAYGPPPNPVPQLYYFGGFYGKDLIVGTQSVGGFSATPFDSFGIAYPYQWTGTIAREESFSAGMSQAGYYFNPFNIGTFDGSFYGTDVRPVLAKFGTTGPNGTINVSAVNDIALTQVMGDLRVGAIASQAGNVVLKAPTGSILNASGQTSAEALSAAQIQAVWSSLGLTGPNAAVNAIANSVTPIQNLVNSDYERYWVLLGNGSASNGTFTLNAGKVPLYKPLAAAALGVDPATIQPAQVQSFAQSLYTGFVADFAKYVGTDWASQAAFQTQQSNFSFILSTAQISSLTNGGTPTIQQLSAFIDEAALGAGGSTVGAGTPNVTGHNVTLVAANSAPASDPTNKTSIGTLGTPVTVAYSALVNGTLTTDEQAAIDAATAPGDVQLQGLNAQGQTVNINFETFKNSGGVLPSGVVSLSGFLVTQTAPLFLTTTGSTTASAHGSIYLQSSGSDLTAAGIASGGNIKLGSTGNIFVAGATPQVNAVGTLTLAATDNIGTAAAPVNYKASELLAASAGQSLYLQTDSGNMLIGVVGAAGTASLNATQGSIFATLTSLDISADSIVLHASGDIGKSTELLQVEVGSNGTLTGTAGGWAYIDAPSAPLQIATLSGASGILLDSSFDLTAHSLASSNGTITAASLGNSTVETMSSHGLATLTAVEDLTLGSNTTPGDTLTGSAELSLGAGGALTVEANTLVSVTGALTVTQADSLTMGANAELSATQALAIAVSGNAELGELVSGLNAANAITVTAGSITANGDGQVNLTATQPNATVALTATTGIGTALLPINVNTPSLTASTAQGDIDLHAVGALTVTSLSANDIGITGTAALTLNSLSATGTIGVNGGGAMIIGTATSGGTQTLEASGALSFTQLTADGAASDNGNISVKSDTSTITGGSVTAHGTASLVADGANGAISVVNVGSGGAQGLHAPGDVEFQILTTTGLGTDAGDLTVTATNGSILGEVAILPALAGTITSHGKATLQAGSKIAVDQLTAANDASLISVNDLLFTSVTSTGGNVTLGSTATQGPITGTTVTATAGSAGVASAGAINLTTVTTGTTLGITSSGSTVSLNTVTSGGAQTLEASSTFGFTQLTSNGTATDHGNISVTSDNSTITGGSVTAHGTASFVADGAGGAISVIGVTSGGTQSLHALGDIRFQTLTTTGLGADAGDLTVVATAGSILGEVATAPALAGTIISNGKATLTAGNKIAVDQLTAAADTNLSSGNDLLFTSVTSTGGNLVLGSTNGPVTGTTLKAIAGSAEVTSAGVINLATVTTGTTLGVTSTGSTVTISTAMSRGTQTLVASGTLSFTQLTTNGTATDNGNISVTSDNSTITGGSVSAHGTASLVADGASGAISVANVGSGGAQLLHALGDIQFRILTTTGLGSDAGDLSVTATNGSILGEVATLPALAGTITSHGKATLTAGDKIAVDQLAAANDTSLTSVNDLLFTTVTSTDGNVVLGSTNGPITGATLTATLGSADVTTAGTVNLTTVTTGTTLGITSSGSTVMVDTATSGGTQTLEASGALGFTQLTTYGTANDNADLSATSDHAAITGGSASAHGTATFTADGTNGAISVVGVSSGGAQGLHALGDVKFQTLTTTGLGSNAGDLSVTATNGSILGEVAILPALAGTITSHGKATLTAGNKIAVDQLTAANDTHLSSSNDLLSTTVESTGGNIVLGSTNGPITGTTLTATVGSAGVTSAGAINLTTVTTGATLGVTSIGSTVTLDTATSGGTQTLEASGALNFTQLTTNGTANDHGNLSVTSDHAAITGGSASAHGTASFIADGTNGAISVVNVGSGGAQRLHALNDIQFQTLTTTGLGSDAGDLSVTATNGSILGEVATLPALAGAMTSHGKARLIAGDKIAVDQLTAANDTSLTSVNDLLFTSVKSTGGNLVLGATNGPVTGATLTATVGSAGVTSAGAINLTTITTGTTLGITSTGSTVILGTATSGGAQTLEASGALSFTQLTTNGTANDNGNMSVTSDHAAITGGSVSAHGTASFVADGANGAISVVNATSGGAQSLHAANDVSFQTLTTTGLGDDAGDLSVTATNGSILGEVATLPALAGTIASHGKATLTAGNKIAVDQLTAANDTHLSSGSDLLFTSVKSTDGNLVLGSTNGPIAGSALTATVGGAGVTSAGAINLTTVSTGTTLGVTSTSSTVMLGSATSSGTQSLKAFGALNFTQLTTTGTASDNGNLRVTSDHAAITGGSASVHGTASFVADSATGAISVVSIASGGAQSLHALNDVKFQSLTTTGTGSDAGDLTVTATTGSILGEVAALPALAGTIASHGKATLTAGNKIAVDQLTAANDTSLSSVNDLLFASVTSTGGNLMLGSTNGPITGANLTATLGSAAVTSVGAINLATVSTGTTLAVTSTASTVTLGTATSGGTQTLRAVNDITFAQLTTTGVGADPGDVVGVSTAGAIHGGAVDAHGSVRFTANDIVFGTITSGDDVDLVSSGDITGHEVTAANNFAIEAGTGPNGGSIHLDIFKASTATLDTAGDLTLGDVTVATNLNLGAATITANITQSPADPVSATEHLQLNVTGHNQGVAETANLFISTPAGTAIGDFFVDNGVVTSDNGFVSIAHAKVADTLVLTTPDPVIYINNKNPVPMNGYNVQLFQPDGQFALVLDMNTLGTTTFIVNYQSQYAVVGLGMTGPLNGGTAINRDTTRNSTVGDAMILATPVGSELVDFAALHQQNFDDMVALLASIMPAAGGGGPLVNMTDDNNAADGTN